MKARATQDGLTVQIIAGTHVNIIAIDLQEDKRPGCLGFSIQKTVLGPKDAPLPPEKQRSYWLDSMLRFPKDTADADFTPNTMDRSPLQAFRWSDLGARPGESYRYTVVAQYGAWNKLIPGAQVQVEVTTEDPNSPLTAVYFNRGAAASEAYTREFGTLDPDKLPPDKQTAAYAWLSHGLEEALLAYLAQATDNSYALHAAIYEFQKPNLLQGLKAALERGATVQVVYHHRKANASDDTWKKNDDAVQANGLQAVCVQRSANPQNAISHNKFVVLLKNGAPQAVWTGSTNWTEGAIYGQLNVGQAIYDPGVAAIYESYFQMLHADMQPEPLKAALYKLAPAPAALPKDPGVYPILSPQPDMKMLDLYASVCSQAKSLLVCAPFELAPQIRDTFEKNIPPDTVHFILADKTDSLGPAQELRVIEGDINNEVSVATTLSSPLHDFQNKLLEGKESYHHAGVHIHAKIIAADPLGDDPIIIFGSANFSSNSTLHNDSNSLIIRGSTAVADIYTTEFMRMFDHYRFRYMEANASTDQPLGLSEDDSWSAPYYAPGSKQALIRQLFAGTRQ